MRYTNSVPKVACAFQKSRARSKSRVSCSKLSCDVPNVPNCHVMFQILEKYGREGARVCVSVCLCVRGLLTP